MGSARLREPMSSNWVIRVDFGFSAVCPVTGRRGLSRPSPHVGLIPAAGMIGNNRFSLSSRNLLIGADDAGQGAAPSSAYACCVDGSVVRRSTTRKSRVGLRQVKPCGRLARRANHFRFSEIVSSPKIKNISLYPKGKSGHESARLTRQEGRIMIVTNVRWDAVDARCR